MALMTPVNPSQGGYRLNPEGHPGLRPPGPMPRDPYDPEGVGGKQADDLAAGSQVDIKTETDPFQREAYGDAKRFADSLADKSNANITNALQRSRDLGAGSIADAAAAAGRRGGAPGSGLSGVLTTRAAEKSRAATEALNANLSDIALGREQAARALEMGGATDIARDKSDMFGKQADLYLGTRRSDLDRADFYARERDRRFDRSRTIADMALNEDMSPADVLGGGAPRGGFSPGMIGRTVPTGLGSPLSPRRRTTSSATRSNPSRGNTQYPATYSDFGAGHPYAGGVR